MTRARRRGPARPAFVVGAVAAAVGLAASVWSCSLDRQGIASTVTTSSTGSGAHGGSGGTSSSTSFSTGGLGGGGNSTGGGGSGGVLDEWTAGTPEATGSYSLPGWLHFASPTGGRTSQTSAATLRAGFGPDVPRARNVGNGVIGWGLSVEGTRTNIVANSDSWPNSGGSADFWLPGTMASTAGQLDPAGGSAAVQFGSVAPSVSNYFHNTTAVFAWSTWASGVAGPPYPYLRGPATVTGQIATAAWQRYGFSCLSALGCRTDTTFDTTDFDGPGPLQAILTPASVLAYGLQLEPEGLYPSSYIPTQATAKTREAETLWSDQGAQFAPAGFFDVEVVLAPHYGDGDLVAGAEHDLVFFDAADRLYVQATAKNPPSTFPSTDLRICLLAGGQAPLCSGTLVWPRDVELTVHARHGSDRRSLTITGATPALDSKQGAAGVPFAALTNVYVLSSPTGAREGADLRRITFNQP